MQNRTGRIPIYFIFPTIPCLLRSQCLWQYKYEERIHKTNTNTENTHFLLSQLLLLHLPFPSFILCHKTTKSLSLVFRQNQWMMILQFKTLMLAKSPSTIRFGDPDWFFFSPVDFKYSRSKRFNRTTKCGFWKATGKDRDIRTGDTNTVIGTKKTLVYYQGRVSCGVKSNWVIHEYHAVTFHENQVRFFYSINFNTA